MRLNIAEKAEYDKLCAEGWTVYRNGWPDFLAYKDGKFRFIEVKRWPDRLSNNQKIMCGALFKLTGLKLEVRQYGKILSKRAAIKEQKRKHRQELLDWARNRKNRP